MLPSSRTSFLSGFVLIVAFFLLMFSGDDNKILQEEYLEAKIIGESSSSFDELSDRFVEIAEKKGALYSFEILRRAELPPQTDLHLLAHVVGDELYKQQGASGIVHCTPEFRNACSHTIVIGTLGDFGEAGLDEIRGSCKEAPGGGGAYTMCYHGLGHGVFSHFVFQFPETVDFCKKTGTDEYHKREYIECVGGAVMELMGGGGHDPYNWEIARKEYLSDDNPLSLCLGDEIPEETKEICLIYLTPEIWESVGIELGNPDPSKFGGAFAVCDEISLTQQNLRDACFGGFGKEFVPLVASRDIRGVDQLTDEQYKTAGSWCMFADADDGRRACIGDAVASLFWGGENNPEASFTFCKLSDDSIRSACYSRLAKDIFLYVEDLGKRVNLCARLPENLQSLCTT
jgi:hypothetical protein